MLQYMRFTRQGGLFFKRHSHYFSVWIDTDLLKDWLAETEQLHPAYLSATWLMLTGTDYTLLFPQKKQVLYYLPNMTLIIRLHNTLSALLSDSKYLDAWRQSLWYLRHKANVVYIGWRCFTCTMASFLMPFINVPCGQRIPAARQTLGFT